MTTDRNPKEYSMLSSRQISQLAKLIEARRLELAGELGEEADRNDPVEAADTDRDIEELRELEAAAERIATGRYGSCVDCAEVIEFERLFARPGVTRCIACQRRHEKTQPARRAPASRAAEAPRAPRRAPPRRRRWPAPG